MPDITKGKTFSSGDTVTAADLNSMLDDAVINDSSITANKLADQAVTSSKITAGTIVNSAISASAAISLSKLEAASDANPKILIVGSDSKPAYQDLSGDATIDASGALTIAAGAVETSMVADDAITQDKIANDSIGSDQIASNAVGASELADDAVDTAAIVDSAITAAKLASGSLAGSPRAPRRVQLTSTTTWTVPSGVTEIYVEMVGGGAIGSSQYSAGGGAYVATHLDVTAGSTITFTVGAAGSGNIQPGGTSSFTHGGTTYSAGGGTWTAGYTAASEGGQASGGEINANGFSAGDGPGYPSMGPWPKWSYGTGGASSGSSGEPKPSKIGNTNITNPMGGAVLITY